MKHPILFSVWPLLITGLLLIDASCSNHSPPPVDSDFGADGDTSLDTVADGDTAADWQEEEEFETTHFCDTLTGVPTTAWTLHGVEATSSSTRGRMPIAVTDNADGVFVVYRKETSTGDDLYLQHIDENGLPTFGEHGVPLVEGLPPVGIAIDLEPDGLGGLYLAVHQERETMNEQRLWRLDSSGQSLWGAGGASLFDGRNISKAQFVTRGPGTLDVVYSELVAGQSQLYLQRLGPDGQGLLPSPVRIGNHSTADWNTAEGDGEGGLFVAWAATEGGTNSNHKYFATHLADSGEPVWPSPVMVSADSNERDAWGLDIEPDGKGGLYLAWHYTEIDYDGFSPETLGVYAAHIDNSGQTTWAEDGVLVRYNDRGFERFPRIAATEDGAMVFWTYESTGRRGVNIQRITADGVPAFEEVYPAFGKELAQRVSAKQLVGMQTDGCGGMVVSWLDKMDQDGAPEPHWNVGLQRVGLDGESTFDEGGMVLTDDTRFQTQIWMGQLGPLSVVATWVEKPNEDIDDPYGTVKLQRIDIE